MDYDKLIKRLKCPQIHSCLMDGEYPSCKACQRDIRQEATTALSTLQAENARLRADLEYEREHANAYHEECGQWEAENEKLREDLEQVKAERGAAVEDLLDAAITPCSYCKRNPSNGGACDMDNDNHEMFSCWKWRGIEED